MRTAGKAAVGFFLLGMTTGMAAAVVVVRSLFPKEVVNDLFGIADEDYWDW